MPYARETIGQVCRINHVHSGGIGETDDVKKWKENDKVGNQVGYLQPLPPCELATPSVKAPPLFWNKDNGISTPLILSFAPYRWGKCSAESLDNLTIGPEPRLHQAQQYGNTACALGQGTQKSKGIIISWLWCLGSSERSTECGLKQLPLSSSAQELLCPHPAHTHRRETEESRSSGYKNSTTLHTFLLP